MKPAPEPRVIAWLDSLPASDVWISGVIVAEIQLGLGSVAQWKMPAFAG